MLTCSDDEVQGCIGGASQRNDVVYSEMSEAGNEGHGTCQHSSKDDSPYPAADHSKALHWHIACITLKCRQHHSGQAHPTVMDSWMDVLACTRCMYGFLRRQVMQSRTAGFTDRKASTAGCTADYWQWLTSWRCECPCSTGLC